jgi:hypothetical protein
MREVTDRRQVLAEKLKAWLPLRMLYMPGLYQYLLDSHETADISYVDPTSEVEAYKLWLPSSLPSDRRCAAAVEGLPMMEEKLRVAQCHDALRGLQHTLRVKSRMLHFKQQNIRGQRDGIRSRTVIDRVHDRARRFAEKYRAGWRAILQLRGNGEWERQLRVLRDEDIRSYHDPARITRGAGRRGTVEDDVTHTDEGDSAENEEEDGINLREEQRTKRDGTGQTRKELSWIWTTLQVNIDDDTDKNDDVLRSEWCKSEARVNRAKEQVLKTREEMRRTIAFLDWRANKWDVAKNARTNVDEGLQDGLFAYAARQENLQLSLSRSFSTRWQTPVSHWEITSTAATALGANTNCDDDDDKWDSDAVGGEEET